MMRSGLKKLILGKTGFKNKLDKTICKSNVHKPRQLSIKNNMLVLAEAPNYLDDIFSE